MTTTKPTHTPTLFLTLHDSEDYSSALCGCILERRSDGEGSNYLRCKNCLVAVNNHQALLNAIMEVCKVIGANETKLNPFQSEALRNLAKAHDIASAEGKP